MNAISVRAANIQQCFQLVTDRFSLQCIYPTIIIIFVSIYMSQTDAVFSSIHNTVDNISPGNLKLGHADRSDDNRALSAIQFNMPQIQNITTSLSNVGDAEQARGVHELTGEPHKNSEAV
jgi:hypothetical protein